MFSALQYEITHEHSMIACFLSEFYHEHVLKAEIKVPLEQSDRERAAMFGCTNAHSALTANKNDYIW